MRSEGWLAHSIVSIVSSITSSILQQYHHSITRAADIDSIACARALWLKCLAVAALLFAFLPLLLVAIAAACFCFCLLAACFCAAAALSLFLFTAGRVAALPPLAACFAGHLLPAGRFPTDAVAAGHCIGCCWLLLASRGVSRGGFFAGQLLAGQHLGGASHCACCLLPAACCLLLVAAAHCCCSLIAVAQC